MLACSLAGISYAQSTSFGQVAVGQSSYTSVTVTNTGSSYPFSGTGYLSNTADFPGLGFIPFASVYSTTSPNSQGDRLLVGKMSMDAYAQLRGQVPLPSFTNEKFCGSVQLVPGQYYTAYVPTAAELAGDFSAFGAPIIDPYSNTPFAGGIIPSSRIPDPLAWRVALSGMLGTGSSLTCLEAFTPQHPGLREGAITATDDFGYSATQFISGIGVGSQVAFTPGLISTLYAGSTSNSYSGIATDSTGTVYIADSQECAIWRINPSTRATAILGGHPSPTGGCLSGGNGSGDGGQALNAQFTDPKGIAVDGAGNIYVADNYVVRKITPDGTITRVAGLANGNGQADTGDGGPATSANLSNPVGLAVDSAGNLYIAESFTDPANFLRGGEVRKVDVVTGIITRFAGTGVNGFAGAGGPAVNAELGDARGIVTDATGNVYIADPNDGVVWKVDQASGIISVYAGTGMSFGNSGDGGPAASARLTAPSGLAIDPVGNIFIADEGVHNIRLVSAGTGVIATVAGNGSITYAGDGSLATATGMGSLIEGPGLAVDASGNLYLAAAVGPSGANNIFEIAQSTTSLNFPAASTSQTQSLTLWNEGNAALDLSSGISISGANASEFAESNTCGTGVAAGAACQISVTYLPGAGPAIASLHIGNQTVAITGASTGAPVTEHIQAFIDSPAAPNIPYLGVVTFSGWAIDNASPVTITILVDGAVIGTTTDTINRADVCSAYPGQLDCPIAGWSFPFDTMNLSSGLHTLEIRAASATGQHTAVSRAFTVANWSATATSPSRVFIDQPNASSGSFSGTANFGGWAVDDLSAIGNISITVDGASYGSASYGGRRTDVCTTYPNRQGCPNVGWNFALDTTALPDGVHTLAVTATSPAGIHSVTTASFTVANLTAQNPLQVMIDTPGTQNPTYTGVAHFGGWAVESDDNNSAIAHVRISIDGLFIADAVYGGTRNDVCAVHPAGAGCPKVGWDYLLDTAQFANGVHMLQVTAVTLGGRQTTVARGFTISNSQAANPTRLLIDVPSGTAPVLTGTANLVGWAANDNAQISSVSVYVDGNLQGPANRNVPRPDVCVVFSNSQGCPNVGWTYVLDTTALANGTHTIAVSATAANGQRNIASSTFTVANWTAAGNSYRMSIDKPGPSTPALAGYSAIGGWAINLHAPVAAVAIAVDGIPVGAASYGGTRGDVCAVFTDAPGCPDVGWNFVLDTTMLSDGDHMLDVTAIAGSQNYTTTAPFKVANLGTPSGIQMIIDTPSTASGAFHGAAVFGGWALSTKGAIATVAISVDGTLDGYAIYGGSGGVRNDVCAVFPKAAGCPEVGWNYEIDTTKYSNGPHTIQVTATDITGSRATESATFNVNN